jgi:hypothetical protein
VSQGAAGNDRAVRTLFALVWLIIVSGIVFATVVGAAHL